MASKEQVQQALDELWEKYGKTLTMLSDALDNIEQKESRIKELETQLSAEPEFDIELSTPAAIAQLEKTLFSKDEES